MTTLYIRHPAKASIDSAPAGSVPLCQFALVGDGGKLLQQGAAVLSSLTDLVAGARRVVLLLAASDVTLLRVKMPPLSAARLKAALPNQVEDQILGDPADCALAAGPALGGDGLRSVAVVQRAWLEALVKALLAQGARTIAAVPAQLCLPLQPGAVAAAIQADDIGQQLTLRLAEYEGLGLTMSSQPLAALQTLRSFAGEAPVALYLDAAHIALYQELTASVPGITIEAEHWAHWVAASRTAGIDLVPALGSAGSQARNWRHWRWPLRLVTLVALVNIVALNVEWFGLKRDASAVRSAMLQTFKSVYPNEAALYPVEQMRRNLGAAKLDSGQMASDEFTAVSAALAEALAGAVPGTPGSSVLAGLEYRERSLFVRLKPNTVDAAAQARVRTALAARQLLLSEPTPGTWQISAGTAPPPAAGRNGATSS